MTVDGRGKAEQVGDSAALKALARLGLIAYAVVHLLIGWLAVQLAWGADASRSADASGALGTVSDQPLGKILLWLVVLGLVALGLWQASEAVWGYRDRDGFQRKRKQVTSGILAMFYAGLGASSALVALGSTSSSSHSQQQATTGVLAWPGGRVIVVVTALILVGVGVVDVVKGARLSFSEEIDTSSMPPAVRKGVECLGQVGYVTKGLALGLMGGLLSFATLTFDRQKAPGLDGTLQTILTQPFGKFLLSAMAGGFLAFGLFAMLQSRYRRM
jgi:hypothetical protein